MRAARPWTVALATAVAGLAVWRAACLLAGPDIDTDAYAHHMIARAILADPRDLSVHWVWLPLFHYLQVPLVWLGGTMQDVRWANVALAAALPVVLYAYVRRTARSADARIPAEATALGAAVFAGASPIAMQMGTTAQPEPLFALLVLATAIALERGRSGWAAAALTAAVLLRYEAWASLAVIAVWAMFDVVRSWRRARGTGTADASASALSTVVVIALPVAAILGWAALRRPVDGRWFGFLGETHEFALGALRPPPPLQRGFVALASDALHYPVVVAVRVLGPVAVFAPVGLLRTWRQQGARFVLVPAACLGFVSLSWVMRATLGLDRHFDVAVPLYATAAAQGIAVTADAVARAVRRIRSRRSPSEASVVAAARAFGAVLGLVVVAGLGVELTVWMGFWRSSIERGWPDRAALGAYLRALPGSPTVFCDDATLEILSGLDRRRFDRHWVDDPHTWDLIEQAAHEDGAVYVATWRRKLRGREGLGQIVFARGASPGDHDSTGVAVMRVGGDGGRGSR